MHDHVFQVFEEMLELNLFERLRPLVVNKSWDYAIQWKLSDDHRCLELMGCICGGTRYIEEIAFSSAASGRLCRDVMLTHPRTKSCDLLDNVPSYIAVDSGVHGEALLSNHSKWLNFSQGTIGARVLVPLPHGLIELSTVENVPKDERLMDFIHSQCSLLSEEQTDLSFLWGLSEWREPLCTMEVKKDDKNTFGEESTRSDYSEPNNDDEHEGQYRKRNGKGHQSKNLEAERKRRKKLNNKLYSLRSLVPNISKLDRTAILGDAVSYVVELQKQVDDLQIELEEHSLDDNAMTILPREGSKCGNESFHQESSGTDGSKPSPELDNTDEKSRKIEPQVEVFQMEGNELFVKVLFEHKAGGFAKLLEALSSLGLQINNVNVTRHNYSVSNVFRVEKRENARNQVADHVKKLLLELGQTSVDNMA